MAGMFDLSGPTVVRRTTGIGATLSFDRPHASDRFPPKAALVWFL
jgi:hypothetical protein